jgi:hypothetical protein
VLTANLQVPTSPAVATWTWNSPGFDSLLYWRGADDLTALAAAAWTLINQGDTIQILPYYQFKLTLEGYRAWAVDASGDADNFTAWAVDVAGVEAEQGYAAEANVPGDVLTYIAALNPLGEFTIVRDIEQAGNISQEVPKAFDDLVAGSHSGLLLNNRQVDGAGDPAPLYSANKASFVFGDNDWYGAQLRIDIGWNKSGFMVSPFLSEPFYKDLFSDFITLYLGKITKWGPNSRGVSGGTASPNTVEIFAKDSIMECLNKRVALPAADGSPAPLTFGEFLVKGEAISGWSPESPLRTAYFENNNFNELDHVVATGGGAFSLITPGLTGARAFRCQTSGANQATYGSLTVPYSGEVFISGTMRFKTAPASPQDQNATIFQIVDASGAIDYSITIDSTGAIYSSLGGQSKFNVIAYRGVPISWALWLSPTNPGYAKLWINGDEVLNHTANLTGDHPLEVRFGVQTGGTSETWSVDFDDVELRTKYYLNAFQVTGAPFASIGPVYLDNLAQPDSQTVGGFTQTLTRFPAYGMVQLSSTDPDFKPSGDVLIRVVENAGGRHALAIMESLLAAAGVTDYIDATALDAAYAAVPKDIVHARFDGKGDRGPGLKDFASLGVTVGDCLKEICTRCLYWLFVDAGKIKIVPYTGTPPADPAMALTAGNLYEATQTIDLDQLNSFVTATYGWYDRDSSLFYVAGVPEAGGQGAGLDYTWGSPVACERLDMVQAKANLLLKFLSAQERLEPVRMNLKGARLELMEVVSVRDELLNEAADNYFITRKDVGLDPGSRETSLQLMRFLGE